MCQFWSTWVNGKTEVRPGGDRGCCCPGPFVVWTEVGQAGGVDTVLHHAIADAPCAHLRCCFSVGIVYGICHSVGAPVFFVSVSEDMCQSNAKGPTH
jgi:hypothetical protein